MEEEIILPWVDIMTITSPSSPLSFSLYLDVLLACKQTFLISADRKEVLNSLVVYIVMYVHRLLPIATEFFFFAFVETI